MMYPAPHTRKVTVLPMAIDVTLALFVNVTVDNTDLVIAEIPSKQVYVQGDEARRLLEMALDVVKEIPDGRIQRPGGVGNSEAKE